MPTDQGGQGFEEETMTMTEPTKVPPEAAGLLDAYAPPEDRAQWTALAEEVERKAPGIADLIGRLQSAYARQQMTTDRLYIEREIDLSDELDNALREASGWERLTQAVYAADLHLVVEDRDRSPEEIALIEQGIAKTKAEQSSTSAVVDRIGALLRDRPPLDASAVERLTWLLRKADVLDAIAAQADEEPGFADPVEARAVAAKARANVAELEALLDDLRDLRGLEVVR